MERKQFANTHQQPGIGKDGVADMLAARSGAVHSSAETPEVSKLIMYMFMRELIKLFVIVVYDKQGQICPLLNNGSGSLCTSSFLYWRRPRPIMKRDLRKKRQLFSDRKKISIKNRISKVISQI